VDDPDAAQKMSVSKRWSILSPPYEASSKSWPTNRAIELGEMEGDEEVVSEAEGPLKHWQNSSPKKELEALLTARAETRMILP